MGYHLILKQEEDKIEHHYVEEYYELAYFPISENSIIYKGDKHWTPSLVKNDNQYRDLSKNMIRGSMIAERIFMDQAIKRKYMLEVIDQDQKTFEQYYKCSKDFLKIKRGDFLLRNVGNLEIEVKCKTVYFDTLKRPYFFFGKIEFLKLLKMQEFTKTPIILAVYFRDRKTSLPNPDKLSMISMNEIRIKVDQKIIQLGKNDFGPSYKIHLQDCSYEFDLVENYSKKLQEFSTKF